MSRGARCYVPGCRKTSIANPEVTFHQPRDDDTKRKWRAEIASRQPHLQKELHVSRVCSSHFADDAYLDTDILQIQLGMPPKRKRLKPDAIPTIFPEQGEQHDVPSAVVQPSSSTDSTATEPQTTKPTSGVRPISQLPNSEDVLVLDGLPLEPLVPFQRVSQFGFLYTLVPHTPEFRVPKLQDKRTQTAVPTFTLGTQTCAFRTSKASQTSVSLKPSSTLSLTSGVPAMEWSEDNKNGIVESFPAKVPPLQYVETPKYEPSLSDAFETSISHVWSDAPEPEEIDTADGSMCPPNQIKVKRELTESSDTEGYE
ncbi:uncharacterized protein LOC135391821 [Ornithodoros turicata]